MIKLDQGAAEPVAKRNTSAFAQIIELPKSIPNSDLKMFVCGWSLVDCTEDAQCDDSERQLTGLTLRVGRTIFGACFHIEDMLEDCTSKLLVGQAGTANSTVLPEGESVCLCCVHILSLQSGILSSRIEINK